MDKHVNQSVRLQFQYSDGVPDYQGGEIVLIPGFGEAEYRRSGNTSLVYLHANSPRRGARLVAEGFSPDEARRHLLSLAKDIAPRLAPQYLREPTATIDIYVGSSEQLQADMRALEQLKPTLAHLGGLAPGFPKLMNPRSLPLTSIFTQDDVPLPDEVLVFGVCPYHGISGVYWIFEALLPPGQELSHLTADASQLDLQCPAIGGDELDGTGSDVFLENDYRIRFAATVAPAGAREGAKGFALLYDRDSKLVDQLAVSFPRVLPESRVRGRYATSANKEVRDCRVDSNGLDSSVAASLLCYVSWSDYPCDSWEYEGTGLNIRVTPDHKLEITDVRPMGPSGGRGCDRLE